MTRAKFEEMERHPEGACKHMNGQGPVAVLSLDVKDKIRGQGA